MTEPSPPDRPLDPELRSILASRAVWHEPNPALEEAVVAAVAAEHRGRAIAPATASSERRRSTSVLVATSAVVITGVVAVGTLALVRGEPAEPGVAVALAAVPAERPLVVGPAPTAMVDPTPTGVRIALDTADLPAAPPGAYYQVWLVKDDHRVSAGTFLGGGGRVELWCGVTDPGYRTVAVTLEDPDDPATTGTVVFEGRIQG